MQFQKSSAFNEDYAKYNKNYSQNDNPVAQGKKKSEYGNDAKEEHDKADFLVFIFSFSLFFCAAILIP